MNGSIIMDDTFTSSLYNFDENRKAFIIKRNKEKRKTKELLDRLRQTKQRYHTEEVKEVLKDIIPLIKNDKYTDYIKANSLLEKEYEWQLNDKESFICTLFEVDKAHVEIEIKIKEEAERQRKERQKREQEIAEQQKKETQRREEMEALSREEARQEQMEKENDYNTFYFILIGIIIGTVALFYTGHWFLGILGIIGFGLYLIGAGVNLFYKYHPD